MSSCPSLNCMEALASPPPLEPNPDVSGIGVLVGFLATAYLTLILLVVHYILVFDPAEAGLKKETHKPNPIDIKVLSFIAKGIKRPKDTKRWGEALEKMVLMMSDQQMITGITLLVSAISQLGCGISAYHWQITIYLVWFSSFTHLATLTFLRGYFYKNSGMRLWRLFFMTALIALLIAALVPTGNKMWLSGNQPTMAGTPAWCLLHYSSPNANANEVSMTVSILILFISYTTRAINLFEWSSKKSRSVFRPSLEHMFKKILQDEYAGYRSPKDHKFKCATYYCLVSVSLALWSWMDLLESMLWEITWLLIALLWGTLRLFATRNATIDQYNNILGENFWGFGQCLATAMLLLLLFSGIETCIETQRLITIDSSVSTIDKGTSSNVDVHSVERRRIRLSPTESNHDSAVALETSCIELGTPADADITSREIVLAEPYLQFPRVARTVAGLSLEERTLGIPYHRQNSIGSRGNELELDEFSPHTPTAPISTAELIHPPPHNRNFYEEKWYTALALFEFCETLLLSGGILSGSYNNDSASENVGVLGRTREHGKMFQVLLLWILCWGPVISTTIAFPYVCFSDMPARRRQQLRASHSFLLRPWFSCGVSTVDFLIYGFAGAFTTTILFCPSSSLHPVGLLPTMFITAYIAFIMAYMAFISASMAIALGTRIFLSYEG